MLAQHPSGFAAQAAVRGREGTGEHGGCHLDGRREGEPYAGQLSGRKVDA